jgi:hypothetical protein
MKKSTSIGSFAWREVNRLALILAAAALPAAAQLTPTVTTLSSTLNPTPAAHSVRITAQLQYTPAAGAYPTGTVTVRFADTGNVLGTAKVQTFGSTAALATQATTEVSTLSEATYTLQASYSGDNIYAPSTSQTFQLVLTSPSSAVTPTINQVVTAASYLPGIQAGSWVSIFGWGVANVADPDVNALAVGIANGFLKTVVDGVSVTINGKNAWPSSASNRSTCRRRTTRLRGP